jgi:DNA-3-methyladenine glycosylase I
MQASFGTAAKIEATIGNARLLLALREEAGSFASYVGRYAPAPSPRPERLTYELLLARTTSPEAEAMAKDLRRRGWRFVGPTTVYSFMQATGVVNDHLDGCEARERVERARAAAPGERSPAR